LNELSKLVAKYADDDNPSTAFDEMEKQNYELMKAYPEGVPSGIMFASMTASVDRQMRMLAGMLIDLAQEFNQWDDEQAAVQEDLTRIMLTLLAGDSLNQILNAVKEAPDASTDTVEERE